jgi:hypothetical protein
MLPSVVIAPAGDTVHPFRVPPPPLTTSSVLAQARQHVAELQETPGVQVVKYFRRWLGRGHVKFWLPQVVGTPTQALFTHDSNVVLGLPSLQEVPATVKNARSQEFSEKCPCIACVATVEAMNVHL